MSIDHSCLTRRELHTEIGQALDSKFPDHHTIDTSAAVIRLKIAFLGRMKRPGGYVQNSVVCLIGALRPGTFAEQESQHFQLGRNDCVVDRQISSCKYRIYDFVMVHLVKAPLISVSLGDKVPRSDLFGVRVKYMPHTRFTLL